MTTVNPVAWPPASGYPAEVLDVHDGDTFTARLDLGFNVAMTIKVRIAGINAPELNEPGGRGDVARSYLLHDIFASAGDIRVFSHRHEQSFNRWVCDVFADGVDVGNRMVDAGWATRL